MRTTLTIDDDLYDALRERASVQGVAFRDVVNDALRRGLMTGSSGEGTEARFEVVPRSLGFRPGVDPSRLNSLLDELESEGFAEHTGQKIADS